MKNLISLLLAFIASIFLFSCTGSANPDTSSEYYVNITNNSDFRIDLYSFIFTNDNSLKNIAPDSTKEIKITEDIDVIEFKIVYHIQIEGIDIPYHDDDCVVRVTVRKDKPVVQNPNINLKDSWLIIENNSSSGLCLFNGLTDTEVAPKNLSGTILNVEESGFYKIDPSVFKNHIIKNASTSKEIPFPFTKIESGKIYKVVVTDSECSLEAEYFFKCTISYKTDYDTNPEDCTMIIGEKLTEKQLPKLLFDKGYIFDGWYDEKTKVIEGYKITNDITLTAKWSLRKYKIEYALDGGENNSNNPDFYTIEDIPNGALFQIDLKSPTRNVDEFLGWYYEEDFSGDVITEPIIVDINTLRDIKVYAKWLKRYIIKYDTKFDIAPKSILIEKGKNLTSEQLPDLIDNDFIFDGWYDGETKVIAGEYTVIKDITLIADWKKYLDETQHCSYHTLTESLNFDFSDLQESGNLGNNFIYSGYSDGVLTIYPTEGGQNIKKLIFKGAYLTRSKTDNHLLDSAITGLCIKLASTWNSLATIIFEDMAFESSKDLSLIDSPVDLLIEYKGNNKVVSSANDAISLICSSNNIIFTGNDKNSSLVLIPNVVKKTDIYEGSIVVKATGTVTIDGGTFVIEGSDGWNNTTQGRNGGNGSTGINASETIVMNNATVKITAGNGADGNKGCDGTAGKDGIVKGDFGQDSTDGEAGDDGQSGGNGGKGGTAIDGNLTIESCTTITLSGGNGGKGGAGGNGGNGGKGGWCSLVGQKSRNGGDGGNGGRGGDGGDGGDAVSGSLIKEETSIFTTAGKHGDGGAQGKYGEPGAGGEKRGWGGGVGLAGNPGISGAPGAPGKDGVEHR